jgi:hypothetical protein
VLGADPVHAQRVENQTVGEVKSAGVDNDLVCVKDSLIFRDAPFLMADDAGAVLATRRGVVAVAVKDGSIH